MLNIVSRRSQRVIYLHSNYRNHVVCHINVKQQFHARIFERKLC